jgi:hypothetical protein
MLKGLYEIKEGKIKKVARQRKRVFLFLFYLLITLTGRKTTPVKQAVGHDKNNRKNGGPRRRGTRGRWPKKLSENFLFKKNLSECFCPKTFCPKTFCPKTFCPKWSFKKWSPDCLPRS